MRRLCLFLLTVVLSACSSTVPDCPHTLAGDVVYVVGAGWHAEIGVPIEELDENLQFYKNVFPGARAIMFGYGKKTFFTAPVETLSEYVLGPFPGPAVIHAVGLRVMPVEAYPAESMVTLTLTPEGGRALSAYIWQDLAKDNSGNPIEVAVSTNPDGLFYDAQSEYNLMHTCNTWTAEALHAADLPISSDNIVFADQVMWRAHEAAEHQCPLSR